MGLILGLGRCFFYGNEPFKKGVMKYQEIGITLPGMFGMPPTAVIRQIVLVRVGSTDEQHGKIS